MTQHEHKYINDHRLTNTADVARALQNIAKQFGGPSKAGCFCKQANVTKYITTFYQWYDNQPTND